MGKKTFIRVASSSVEGSSTLSSNDHQDTTRSSKTRALKVLGEYMRYFSSVNGLYRNIVHMQAEVLSKYGQRRWKNLSQEHQDEAFNRHIINTENSQSKTKSGLEEVDNAEREETNRAPRNRRDSLQSVSDQDCFSGPFSWKSKSLQDLVFPSTPKLNLVHQEECDSKHHVDKETLQLKSMTSDLSRTFEGEVASPITLDQLHRELRTNYEEQQAARLKIQLTEKNIRVHRECERITKAAVKQRFSQNLSLQNSSGAMTRFSVASSGVKHATQLRQVKREIMCTRPKSDKSPLKIAHRSQTSSISPTKVPCTMAHIKHERNFVKNETDESSLKHYSNRESLDFDEILKAVEEAHQKRTNISTARNDVLLQRNCETTMNNTISQERPNSNGSSVLNQHKISGKEISWDLSRDLRQRNDRKSETDDGNSDIMDLFKNW